MHLRYFLPALCFSLPALWALGFIAEVLRDNQVSADLAMGAIVAVLLLMVTTASLLALLIWPLYRAMSDDSRKGGEPLTNER